MDNPETLQNFYLLLLSILGLGLVALLATPFSRWWQKHSSVALTWMWMILFTIASGIVMLVLFILPRPSKNSS